MNLRCASNFEVLAHDHNMKLAWANHPDSRNTFNWEPPWIFWIYHHQPLTLPEEDRAASTRNRQLMQFPANVPRTALSIQLFYMEQSKWRISSCSLGELLRMVVQLLSRHVVVYLLRVQPIQCHFLRLIDVTMVSLS